MTMPIELVTDIALSVALVALWFTLFALKKQVVNAHKSIGHLSSSLRLSVEELERRIRNLK